MHSGISGAFRQNTPAMFRCRTTPQDETNTVRKTGPDRCSADQVPKRFSKYSNHPSRAVTVLCRLTGNPQSKSRRGGRIRKQSTDHSPPDRSVSMEPHAPPPYSFLSVRLTAEFIRDRRTDKTAAAPTAIQLTFPIAAAVPIAAVIVCAAAFTALCPASLSRIFQLPFFMPCSSCFVLFFISCGSHVRLHTPFVRPRCCPPARMPVPQDPPCKKAAFLYPEPFSKANLALRSVFPAAAGKNIRPRLSRRTPTHFRSEGLQAYRSDLIETCRFCIQTMTCL